MGGSTFQPPGDQLLLRGVDAGEPERHSPVGVLSLERTDFRQVRAGLLAIDSEVESRSWQDALLHQRVTALEVEHAVEQAAQPIVGWPGGALVQDGEEVQLAPCRRLLGVLEQPGWPDFQQALPVIDLLLAGSAGDPVPGAELELAGGIVTAVADDAPVLEEGQYILAERGCGRGGRGRGR